MTWSKEHLVGVTYDCAIVGGHYVLVDKDGKFIRMGHIVDLMVDGNEPPDMSTLYLSIDEGKKLDAALKKDEIKPQ